MVESGQEDPTNRGAPAYEEVGVTERICGFLGARGVAVSQGMNAGCRGAAFVQAGVAPRCFVTDLPVDVLDIRIGNDDFATVGSSPLTLHSSLVDNVMHCILPHQFALQNGG